MPLRTDELSSTKGDGNHLDRAMEDLCDIATLSRKSGLSTSSLSPDKEQQFLSSSFLKKIATYCEGTDYFDLFATYFKNVESKLPKKLNRRIENVPKDITAFIEDVALDEVETPNLADIQPKEKRDSVNKTQAVSPEIQNETASVSTPKRMEHAERMKEATVVAKISSKGNAHVIPFKNVKIEEILENTPSPSSTTTAPAESVAVLGPAEPVVDSLVEKLEQNQDSSKSLLISSYAVIRDIEDISMFYKDSVVTSTDSHFSPHPYQLEAAKATLQRNTIVTFPTGTGKTFISSLVLSTFLRSISLADKYFVVLLPTVLLAQQQRRAIDRHLRFFQPHLRMVTSIIGSTGDEIMEEDLVDLKIDWNHSKYWKMYEEALTQQHEFYLAEKNLSWPIPENRAHEFITSQFLSPRRFPLNSSLLPTDSSTIIFDEDVNDEHTVWPRVFVMTPAKFCLYLARGLMRMGRIGLLVFDEAHHYTHEKSLHPYAMIMKHFYERSFLRPRILALTASPLQIHAKDYSDALQLISSRIKYIESLYDSNIFVNSFPDRLQKNPHNFIFYDPPSSSSSDNLHDVGDAFIQFQLKHLDDIFFIVESFIQGHSSDRIYKNSLLQDENISLLQERLSISSLKIILKEIEECYSLLPSDDKTALLSRWKRVKEWLRFLLNDLGFWFLYYAISILKKFYSKSHRIQREDFHSLLTSEEASILISETMGEKISRTYFAYIKFLCLLFDAYLIASGFSSLLCLLEKEYNDFSDFRVLLKEHHIVTPQILAILEALLGELYKHSKTVAFHHHLILDKTHRIPHFLNASTLNVTSISSSKHPSENETTMKEMLSFP
ncbi:hypothetical protein IE077_003587, partial [Cardiosporidium cionae]